MVLDEVTYPVTWEWIDVGDVVETIRTRPDHVTLGITGRDAPQALSCLLYTSPSPRDRTRYSMPSSALQKKKTKKKRC